MGIWQYDEEGNLVWEKLLDADITKMVIDHLINSYSFYGSIAKVDSKGELVWTYTPGGMEFWSGNIGKSGLIIAVDEVEVEGGEGDYYIIFQGYTPKAVLQTKEPIIENYYSLHSFSAQIPDYSFGNIYFQLSTDKINWYHFDGSDWVKTLDYSGNSADEINDNISKFSEMHHSPLYVRVILDSLEGNWPVELNSITVGYSGQADAENGVNVFVSPETGANLLN